MIYAKPGKEDRDVTQEKLEILYGNDFFYRVGCEGSAY
jgi:hypothetical protein